MTQAESAVAWVLLLAPTVFLVAARARDSAARTAADVMTGGEDTCDDR